MVKMPSTTVQYIIPNRHSNEIKNTPKDIKIFYLKAAIVILALALAAVSAVLVWRLLAHKNGCDEHLVKEPSKDRKDEIPFLDSQRQSSKKGKHLKCPQVGKKNLLPYTLPRGIQKTFMDVKELLQEEIAKKTLVSVSCTAVYRNEQLWNAAYGILDKSTFLPKAPNWNTLYSTGSLVKLLTVLVTFKLFKEKKLECLDDSLQKYLPEFSVKNPFNKDSITIRQILSHTSGLPREVPCGPSFSSEQKNICPVNTTFVYEELKNTKLKFPPGTAVGYSNLGYALLAHTLFEKFGSTYGNWQQWMLHEILHPLGMTRTVLKNSGFHHNVAQSYKANGILSPEFDWGWSSPSFQMKTSAADLAKVMLAILNPGTSFIDERMTKDMFGPEYIYPDLHTIFSPGWQIRYNHSIRIISKAGAVPGSSAAIILMPEQRFGMALLASGQEIVPKLAKEISMKLSKSFSTNVVSKSLEIKSTPSAYRYTGVYILKNNWSDKVKATISIDSFTGRMILKQDPGYPPFVYLSFKNSQLLEIVYPHGLACDVYALGQDKEDIKFKHPDYKGRFKQFTLGSFVFKRTHA